MHFLGLPGRLPCIPNLHPKFSSQNSANQTFRRLLDKERLLKYLSKAENKYESTGIELELQEKCLIRICPLEGILPSIDALFGRMVIAPSATLSCWTTGDIFEPQLSDPTHRKWPVWLLRFAASNTRLKDRQTKYTFTCEPVKYPKPRNLNVSFKQTCSFWFSEVNSVLLEHLELEIGLKSSAYRARFQRTLCNRLRKAVDLGNMGTWFGPVPQVHKILQQKLLKSGLC